MPDSQAANFKKIAGGLSYVEYRGGLRESMRPYFLNKGRSKRNSGAGFTIPELLAVLAVIILLAVVAIVIFNDHKIAERNSARGTAVAKIRSVLEENYKTTGAYPIETQWCLAGAGKESGLYCQNLSVLIESLPLGSGLDPSSPKEFQPGCAYGYYYRSSPDGKSYEMASRIERYSSKTDGKNFLYVSSSSGGREAAAVAEVGGLCVAGSLPASSGREISSALFANYPSAQFGYSNSAGFIYATPFFSLVNDQLDPAIAVQIRLGEDGSEDPVWDSGDISIAPTASGQRTPDIFYGSGNPALKILEAGKSYKWRARVKTSSNPEKYSDWSPDAVISMAPSDGFLVARFYSGPGTGYVESKASSWSRARNPSKGKGSLSDMNQFRAGTSYDGTYSIQRGFAPVDASAIPDDSSITSAVFVFSGSGNSGGSVCGWSAGNMANIVLSDQADPLLLSPEDFGKCGDPEDPETGSVEGTAFSSGTGLNYVLTMNAAGRSWISKTGWTTLGLRSANDIGNQSCLKYYTNGMYSNFFNTEKSKPYIEVVYAGGGSGQLYSLPIFLSAGYPTSQFGGSDPSDFAFSTPFFSFVSNMSDQSDIDVVQIQVADYSYSDPVWDSGDISIAPTASGQRTPDIFYGSGNPALKILEAGKSYKWRARVKTSSNPEKYSDWSPDAVISMASDELTARFYSAAGDGTVEQSAGSASQMNWQAAHDSQDPVASTSVAKAAIGTIYGKEIMTIRRGFFLFDTSWLPDSVSVLGGSLAVWVESQENKGDDGRNWLSVVQSFQESSELVPDDYKSCGSDDGTAGRAKYTPIQEGSDRITLAGISSDGYAAWNFNADGKSWISKSGFTKLGLREGHDILDYRNRGYLPSANAVCYFFENGDKNKSPYLEVSYR